MSRFADLPPARNAPGWSPRSVRTSTAATRPMWPRWRPVTPDAVHYFPRLEGPWVGSTTIAENWRRLVLTIGSAWSIEASSSSGDLPAVIEWTHWKTRPAVTPGDEWYRFDPDTGLITEIRAFYASASDGRSEVTLQGYDYAAGGHQMEPPVKR
ncbi:nuclear transport factor 2 family protein, partial [Streptomyces sp. FXJ1.4098]|nr:nuclear transport factor 2 family protein [Streptomyces sp. FXJ1.4098]